MKRIINAFLLLPFIMVLFTVRLASEGVFYGVSTISHSWFFYSVALTLFSILLISLINRKVIVISIIDILLLIFSASGIILTTFYTEGLNVKVFALIVLTILYFNFRVLFAQVKGSRFILIIFFVITGLFEAILGMQQLYGYSNSNHYLYKVTGSFQNPGPYAGYLAMIFPIAGYYVFSDWRVIFLSFNKRYLLFYIRLLICFSALITITLILPATMSRASWIAVFSSVSFVGLAICFYQKKIWITIRGRFFSSTRMISLTLISVIVFAFIIPKVYYLKKDSADGRLLMWKISSKAVYNNISGVGIGYFGGAYGIEQAKYFESGKGSKQEQHVADSPEYAFNDYLQIAVEFGLFPFFIFIMILSGSFCLGLKSKANLGLVGAYIAVLIFALMSYPFSLLPFLISFVFLLALLNNSGVQEFTPSSNSYRLKPKRVYLFIFNYRFIVFIMILSYFIIAYCFYNQRPIAQAYQEARKAKGFYRTSNYDEAIKSYSKLIPFLGTNPNILFDYGQALNREKRYLESNEILRKAAEISSDPMIYNIIGKNHQELSEYELAEYNYQKASQMVPNRVYPYFLKANLYVHLGELSKAKKAATIVLEKEPKVDSEAIREMKLEMKKILEME